MLLSKIKLVGFKSFVDATSILFPSRLVGIVGPNGCGKSNVIDAVRWVMGESSASRLRGEQGTDVIFNGSGGRQPLAQASVELFFDNSDASLGGEYAQYSEISIRRVVGRDAVSHYFLNGTRCRRKDIADIFLGTGLGPRSYAIIQQGTISRLIEAKPEDLRLMLEEAAGISKYKERRKETETRIRGARENLERLQDVRIELDKQLATLQRQASAAERFKALKIEYRQAKSALLALRWKVVADNILSHQQKISAQETQLVQVMTEVRHVETHIEQLRLKHTESLDLLNESQTDFYRQKSELAKTEQEIEFQSTRRDQLQQDLNGAISQWETLSTAIQRDCQQYQQRQETAQNLHPEYTLAHRESESTAKELQKLESLLTESQQAWQIFREKISSASKTAEVEQAHIQQYEQRILIARNKLQKLDDSLKHIDVLPHEEKIRILTDEIDSQRKTVESTQHLLLSSKDAVTLAQQKLRESSDALDRLKYQRQQLEGKRVSLEVLQKAALESHDQETKRWLSTHGFGDNKRLAQSIQVSSGWEHAVETVLGDFLQAICVDEFSKEHSARLFADFQSSTLALVCPHVVSVKHAQRLVDKVHSDYCPDILNSIWAVDTLEDALALQPDLQSHESVVTKDGLWLGPHWLRVTHKKDAAYGVLEREKELQAVVNDIQQTEKLLEQHQQSHDDERQQLRHQQTLVEDLQQQHQLLFSRLSQKEAELRVQKSLLEQLLSRRQGLSQELIENQHDIEQLKEKLSVSRDLWNQALEQLSHLQSEQSVLEKEKEEKTLAVQAARHHHQVVKQRFHDLSMKKNITDVEIKSLEKNIAQLEAQLLTLEERKKKSAA
ncbi:MAG: chromosome segregation protein SMC [Gammaproteobacteria bacterium]|nr:chromosome segregation protein SMC [Gammaproteobacteria bacterium]